MKIGVITIFDEDNYGNRLQNYALQESLEKLNVNAVTFKNLVRCNFECKDLKSKIKLYIIYILKKIQNLKNNFFNYKRWKYFKEFNQNINIYKTGINGNNAKKIEKEFDFFIAGSDQIWNPKFRNFSYIDTLQFTSGNKSVSYAASLGINSLDKKYNKTIEKSIAKFKAISVREDAGKDILEQVTTRKDIQVLVDPTMLLSSQEWDKVAKKPKQLNSEKYILNYFLGELSEERKKEINRIAKENKCEVINILDKNSPFYQTGPSEFLYLEKNAFLICTDSFHSSVFAILYNRPFIVFNREDKNLSMNSRIETLINKFKLENREFLGKITNENLLHDYSGTYEILEEERQKSITFLKDALNIKS